MGNDQKQPEMAVRTIQIRNEVIVSEELFGIGQKIWIHHNKEKYELRVTRQGKLILTK